MSKSSNGLRKAGLASLAVTLTLGAGFVAAGSASAVEDFKFDRFDGDNRYHTSTLVADEYNETNPHVILAPGEHGKYADALTANYLSGSLDAPILLTRQDFTPKPVLAQLEEDNTERITIVGGNASVSTEQEAALVAAGYTVNRLSGADRFATNAEVIESVETDAVDGTGLIATGFNFADALAGGPVTYQGHPLGLSTQDDIEQDVIDALKGAGVTQVYILGGETVVGPEVAAKLEANDIDVAGRLAGANRAATSVEIAEFAIENLDFVDTHVGVASGYVEGSGADALAGGPLEGTETAPMLVTRNERNPGEVTDFIEANCDTIDTGHVYGGQVAITAAAEAEMTDAAQCDAPVSNQDFAVTPAEAATNTVSVSDGTTAEQTQGERQYSVSGLEAGTYNVQLFDADDVTVDDNGVVTFDGTGTATLTEDNVGGVITVINGSTADGDNTETASPVNGTISFTVDAETADSVIPVIFLDAETSGDNDLDINAAGEPTEEFGIGGQKTWLPAEAAVGSGSGGVVVDVNTGEDYYTLDTDANDVADVRINYVAGDTFYYGAGTTNDDITMAQFEEWLSAGDEISITNYNPGGSTFGGGDETDHNLDVDVPNAPTTLNATENTDGDVELSWTAPTNPDVVDYQIQRATQDADGDWNYTNLATTGNDNTEYVDTTAAEGETYRYRVAAENSDTDLGPWSNVDDVTLSVGADETDPTLTSATLVTDNDASTVADETGTANGDDTMNTGDQIRFVFSERVVLAADSTLTFSDADGTVGEVRRGVNATFQQSASGNTVIVTLTGAPIQTEFGDTLGVQYTATLDTITGVEDAAGNELDYTEGSETVGEEAVATP